MQRQEAEEHLRVIRSLMEKATVYRAIAAPTALIAGLLAIGAAYVGIVRDSPLAYTAPVELTEIQRLSFLLTWAVVLIVVAAANGWFLYADAKRREEKFISSGMKMALLALLPSHLTALVLSHIFAYRPEILATVWIILHGIGLLATSHFSPRSMINLGWAFLVAGILCVFHYTSPPHGFFAMTVHKNSVRYLSPYYVMAITFGLFHLIYAACTWPRKSATHGDE